jgi:hypothetical protein
MTVESSRQWAMQVFNGSWPEREWSGVNVGTADLRSHPAQVTSSLRQIPIGRSLIYPQRDCHIVWYRDER